MILESVVSGTGGGGFNYEHPSSYEYINTTTTKAVVLHGVNHDPYCVAMAVGIKADIAWVKDSSASLNSIRGGSSKYGKSIGKATYDSAAHTLTLTVGSNITFSTSASVDSIWCLY